jgi:hypothetical protein
VSPCLFAGVLNAGHEFDFARNFDERHFLWQFANKLDDCFPIAHNDIIVPVKNNCNWNLNLTIVYGIVGEYEKNSFWVFEHGADWL